MGLVTRFVNVGILGLPANRGFNPGRSWSRVISNHPIRPPDAAGYNARRQATPCSVATVFGSRSDFLPDAHFLASLDAGARKEPDGAFHSTDSRGGEPQMGSD